MNKLLTEDPVALSYLMSETLFVIGPDTAEAASEAEVPSVSDKWQKIPFLGENRSSYLFVTEERDHEWLSESAMDAFGKSLSALQLSMGEIALVNLARIRQTHPRLSDDVGQLLHLLLKQFKPSKAVLLGVEPKQLGFDESSLPLHQAVNLQEVSWICTHSFSEMLLDTEKKRVFWTSIKSFF